MYISVGPIIMFVIMIIVCGWLDSRDEEKRNKRSK